MYYYKFVCVYITITTSIMKFICYRIDNGGLQLLVYIIHIAYVDMYSMHSIQKSIHANTKSVYGTDVITTCMLMVSTNAIIIIVSDLF